MFRAGIIRLAMLIAIVAYVVGYVIIAKQGYNGEMLNNLTRFICCTVQSWRSLLVAAPLRSRRYANCNWSVF
jgi:hypothetical protein